jgi:predicted nuclease of restriction endonuclease-like RecB superfamily
MKSCKISKHAQIHLFGYGNGIKIPGFTLLETSYVQVRIKIEICGFFQEVFLYLRSQRIKIVPEPNSHLLLGQ